MIRRGHSCLTDGREAVREFHAAVRQPETAFVVFFCSSGYDLGAVAEEMHRHFAGVQVIGCTTAGEIGPAGYQHHSICGASFPGASFAAVSGLIRELQQFDFSAGQAFAQAELQTLEARAPRATAENSFALLLVDGLSIREEPVARALQSALGDIPLVGGSAADDLNFARTHVYFGGRFHDDAAVMVLATTTLPFTTFKIQHFAPAGERMVVTDADAAHRVVREINGLPATEEYARIIGVDPAGLGPVHFASSPVVVLINGSNYVRSIQKSNPDGSMTFYCAIEEGVVLRVARGIDVVTDMTDSFAHIRAEIGAPELVIAFSCILRDIEVLQKDLVAPVCSIFAKHNAIGFSTYGEQYRGLHVNQTLTGIAIGAATEARGG